MEFNTIYQNQFNRVSGLVKFKIKNKEEAEELVTDIFMKVHNKLTEFDSEKSTIGTWVFAIAKNAIIDYWRTKKNHTISISDLVDSEGNEIIPNQYTDNLTPETDLLNGELGNKIMNAIVQLPMQYQRVANQFFIQEKSHEEISNYLSIPIGSVKGTIHRAKDMLRKRLSNL